MITSIAELVEAYLERTPSSTQRSAASLERVRSEVISEAAVSRSQSEQGGKQSAIARYKAGPTAARIKELLSYDENTRVFFWRERRHGVRHNLLAGTVNKITSRRRIHIDGHSLPIERVVSLYKMEGSGPQ
jgi:hypothetical protein